MQSILILCVNAAWIVTGIVWLVGAIRTKRTVWTQTSGSRLPIGIGDGRFCAASSTTASPLGPLDRRLSLTSALSDALGLVLTLAGTGFAIWARVFLGRNWSAIVTIKHDHQMISSGPYALVRHPIYSGFLLGTPGDRHRVWRNSRF